MDRSRASSLDTDDRATCAKTTCNSTSAVTAVTNNNDNHVFLILEAEAEAEAEAETK